MDVVAAGWLVVAAAGWASRAWPGGFRCSGGATGLAAEVPKSSPDAGGSEAFGRCGAFPGAAEVGDRAAGEAELGVGGQDEPGPAVGGGWVAGFWAGPAEGLFEHAEGVLDVESPEECLPGQVGLVVVGGGVGPPEPDRFRVASGRQPFDGQPDDGALDDR